MINVNKKYTILSGQAPYRVFVEGQAEITFLSTNEFEVEFTFDSVDTISDMSISVIDANGCASSLQTSANTLNPCTDFFVSPISKLNRRYSVDVVSDSSVTYDWDYDQGLFQGIEGTGFIDLTQVTGGPVTSTLTLTVNNADGCSEVRTFEIPVCRAFARNETAQFIQVGDNYVANVALRANSSCTEGMNWNTLNISGNTTGLTIVTNGPNVTITSPTLPADVVLEYTVRDNTNVLSNVATLSLSASGQLGLNVPDIIINSLPDVGDIEIDISNDIRGFVDPTTINVNNNLTTSNVTANNSDAVFNITMTGTTGVVGYDAQDINGNVLDPGIISLRRNFANFTTTNITVNSSCLGGNTTYVLSSNPTVTEITSIIGATGITKNGINPVAVDIAETAPTQTITLNVKNGNNQTGSLILNFCGDCDNTTVVKEVCEEIINPYSMLTKPVPNGTWTTTNGAPLPTTYNADVTLPTTGLFEYVYTIDVSTPGGETCPTVDSPLNVTRVAGNTIINNDCANAKPLFAIHDAGTSSTVEAIGSNCSSLTTFSKTGANGNLGDYTYDQWFTYQSSSTLNGGTSMNITVTITGIGGTPIQSPAVQLWNSCVTPIVTSYNQTANQIVASFNVPTDGSVNDYFIQVCSDSLGDYSVFIEQEIV
jgi:hypothetical protein